MSNSLKLGVDIPFPDAIQAEIAYNSLRVDRELPGTGVQKTLKVEGNILQAQFTAPSAKSMRSAVNGFFISTSLVTETIKKFGPPVTTQYSYFSP